MLNNSEKYRQYEAEDFAADEAFLAWVKSGKGGGDWESWLSVHSEKQQAVEQAKSLISLMHAKDTELDISQDKINNMWAKIQSGMHEDTVIEKETETPVIQLNQNNNSTSNNKNTWRYAMPAAASILLLLGFFWWWSSNTDKNFETGVGEQLAVTLPDGSVVTLNAESKISFNEQSWKDERKVDLDGEAFFEVKKGEKFTVETSQGNVRVMGTSFNVFERAQRFEVACYTGKVGVTNSKADIEEVLTPGNKVSIVNNKVQRSDFKPEGTVAWRTGVFRFEDVSLIEVLDELQRQYGFEVKVNTDIKDRKYSGSFTSEDLDEALKMICLPMELEYKIAEDSLLIVIEED
ncbi:FecR family protein [Chondrinema litorale]|uniref:FecR family protein n=1 Tax=Chondrinema litorale TaxID=2994555 RepID=UPI002542C8CC|nr:FecR domain-containing protein [Chondrinema litorale]UZR99932.1 FecR domain-containing protein [Chondrinema litorale]